MLLFMKVGDGTGMSILYYTALTIGFWISFGTFFVPYAALGAEITDDYDDRSSIRSFAYIGNQAGMFFGMVAPPFIVSVVADLGHGIDKGWTAAGAAVGITVLLSLLFTVWATRGYERYTPRGVAGNKDIGAKRGLRHMVKSYREILGLKPMLILLLAAMLSLVAFTVGSSAFIYFLTFNLGLSESNISAVMLVKLGSGIALAPVVLYLAKRTDRRITLIICCAFTTVFILVQYSVGIISIVGACVMAIAFDVFGTAYWQLVPAIIYDICELDEFENGTRREGSVVSTLSFAESLSSAISLQMLGIILKISGFDGGALTQSESSLDAIAICTMVLPAVLMAVVVVVMCMYPISKGEFARIKGEVERRRRG
jgi:GPH family glycoside/pentoside/hexuronide:cation symporter